VEPWLVLLDEIVLKREGLGDVVVWPSAGSADGTGGKVLNIELSSPFGQAHFEAPIKEISDFLTRTYAIVPSGDSRATARLPSTRKPAMRRLSSTRPPRTLSRASAGSIRLSDQPWRA